MTACDAEFEIRGASGLRLVFSRDAVVKHHRDPQQMRLELEKTQLGAVAARASGRFEVPRVLAYDFDNLTIAFERLHGLSSLRQVLCGSANVDEVTMRAAQALAAVHGQDPAPNESPSWGPDLGVHMTSPTVFVHGDFSVTNILCAPDRQRPVVLDWAPPPWLPAVGLRGPGYLDLSIFVLSLFLRRPFEPLRIADPGRLALIFLEGYRSELRQRLVVEEFKAYFAALLPRFVGAPRNPRAKLRLIACYPSLRIASSFVRSLELGP